MNAKISCSCGQAHSVRFADAGRKILCTCQNVIEVPKLSELHALSGMQEQNVGAVDQAELTPEQMRGRKLLIIISVLMGCYELAGRFLFNQELEELRQTHIPIRSVGYVGWFIVFATLSFFACIGKIWARMWLIIRGLIGIGILFYANYGAEWYYLIDVAIMLAYIFALLRIRT